MGKSIDRIFLLVSEKRWHDDLFDHLVKRVQGDWHRIGSKQDFTVEHISRLNPSLIFIPHWSYKIESTIYEKFECIVFHMTDLPFGRGGSPLQNLIVRGIKQTKISALRVDNGIDTGDIYQKKELSLDGTAKDIFIRASSIIEEMIIEIIREGLKPFPQEGEVVMFKRRKPSEGNIANLSDVREVYDYIRMLDCDNYPKAFIETKDLKFEFDQAAYENDKTITAHVRITKK